VHSDCMGCGIEPRKIRHRRGRGFFIGSKATCAAPPCEVLTPCRGLRPHQCVTGAGPHTAREQYSLCRHSPEVGAVCGKAARTDLGGGRAMKRTFLPLLRRREFIVGLGGAVAWPMVARAQQQTMPVVGWLGSQSQTLEEFRAAPFRQGL